MIFIYENPYRVLVWMVSKTKQLYSSLATQSRAVKYTQNELVNIKYNDLMKAKTSILDNKRILDLCHESVLLQEVSTSTFC